MAIFSKFSDFLKRHRTKFIFVSILIGGSVLLGHYAHGKLQEWQEREMREFLERNRRQHNFETIERNSNQTIRNLHTTLMETINTKLLNTQKLIDQLKTKPDNQLEVWTTLKMQLFTKTACTIYSTVLFVVVLKIQFSLIGGYLFRDSAGGALSPDIQQNYLSICQEFLNTGLTDVTQFIEDKCRTILEPVALNRLMKYNDLEALFWSIQVAVACDDDHNPIDKIRQIFIPFSIAVASYKNPDIYNKLITDTIDLLETDEVKALVLHSINRGFTLLMEELTDSFNNTTASTSAVPVKKPLAKFLPILNGLFAKQTFPHAFIHQLLTCQKLQTLSANIFESLI